MANGYPPDWNKRRRLIYRRDNYQCQKCGRQGGPHGDAELHCHHIRPKSKGGSHHPSNLQTLCWQCHNRVHKHHVPRRSSRRSRSESTSDSKSCSESSCSKSRNSPEIKTWKRRSVRPAILKGFLTFLLYIFLYELLGGFPKHGALSEITAIFGLLIWFAVSHADVGESNTLYMTSLIGYVVFVVWMSFTYFSGILTFLSGVYFFGVSTVTVLLVTELNWISGKSTDSINNTSLDLLSKIAYFALGVSSWPVTWWLLNHGLEALNIVQMAEQTLTSTPTPVSWEIAEYIQSIGATLALSVTLFAVFCLRSIAEVVTINRIEEWGIIITQFILISHTIREFIGLAPIARTAIQIAFPLLFLTTSTSIGIWTLLSTYSDKIPP